MQDTARNRRCDCWCRYDAHARKLRRLLHDSGLAVARLGHRDGRGGDDHPLACQRLLDAIPLRQTQIEAATILRKANAQYLRLSKMVHADAPRRCALPRSASPTSVRTPTTLASQQIAAPARLGQLSSAEENVVYGMLTDEALATRVLRVPQGQVNVVNRSLKTPRLPVAVSVSTVHSLINTAGIEKAINCEIVCVQLVL